MIEQERRVVSLGSDLHAEGEPAAPRRIIGHASVFDTWTTLYEGPNFTWREIVRRGAYKRAIAEKQDVRALWNHDANFVLGRTASGTLRLSEDDTGLLMDLDPPDTPTIRDLVIAPIARGDVTQMSFAFTVRPADEIITSEKDGRTVVESGGERITTYRDGERTIEERELLDLNLYDVSPVTYPAYKSTDVSLRSQGERRESHLLTTQTGRLERIRQRMRMRLRLVDARTKGPT